MKNSRENVNSIIASNVIHFRSMKKMTQQQLAEVAEIATPTVGHMEAGSKPPGMNTLIKIANALEIDFSELFIDRKVENKLDEIGQSARLVDYSQKLADLEVINQDLLNEVSVSRKLIGRLDNISEKMAQSLRRLLLAGLQSDIETITKATVYMVDGVEGLQKSMDDHVEARVKSKSKSKK